MKSKDFVLKQTSTFSWVILAPSNIPICEERCFSDQYQAEQFCEAYISSWPSANYKVEPLKISKK